MRSDRARREVDADLFERAHAIERGEHATERANEIERADGEIPVAEIHQTRFDPLGESGYFREFADRPH